MSNATIIDPASSKMIEPGLVRLFFPGFLDTDWSAAYMRAIDKAAREISIQYESALDHFTMVHAMMLSTEHVAMQREIAKKFLSALCAEITLVFDLRFRVELIKLYSREIIAEYSFAQAKAEIVQLVVRTVRQNDGQMPPDHFHEDCHMMAWLIMCLNAVKRAKFGEEGADVYAEILHRFEREETMSSLLRDSIDRAKMIALVNSPLDTIAASRSWAAT